MRLPRGTVSAPALPHSRGGQAAPEDRRATGTPGWRCSTRSAPPCHPALVGVGRRGLVPRSVPTITAILGVSHTQCPLGCPMSVPVSSMVGSHAGGVPCSVPTSLPSQRTGPGVPGGPGRAVGAAGGRQCAPAPAPAPLPASGGCPVPGRHARAGPAHGPPAPAQVRLRGPGVTVPSPLYPCPPPCHPPYTLLLPAECAGGLVAFACGKPCPHSCEDLREDTACMATPRCLPACACPHGQLLQDGDCVSPERCRCAWGACWGHVLGGGLGVLGAMG